VYGKGERHVGFGVGSGVGSTEGNGVDSVMVSVGRSLSEIDIEGAVGAGAGVGTGVVDLLSADRVAAWSCSLGVVSEKSRLRLGGCGGRSGNENQS
jgi:hypothetical protein